MAKDIDRRTTLLGLSTLAAGTSIGSKTAAQDAGTQDAISVLSNPEAVEVLKKWRGHINITIGRDGQLLAGWGYPQSVPHITQSTNEILNEGTTDWGSVIKELKSVDPDQTPSQ